MALGGGQDHAGCTQRDSRDFDRCLGFAGFSGHSGQTATPAASHAVDLKGCARRTGCEDAHAVGGHTLYAVASIGIAAHVDAIDAAHAVGKGFAVDAGAVVGFTSDANPTTGTSALVVAED